MSGELRDRVYGLTVDEYVSQVPAELAVDAVGLWQVFAYGREGFGLSGEPLADLVRQSILALLAKGAKPVVGARDGLHFWYAVNYGEKPEEIADAIIREWRLTGPDPDPGGVWFALPHIYEAVTPHERNLDADKLDS
jgi:hypothetical protein